MMVLAALSAMLILAGGWLVISAAAGPRLTGPGPRGVGGQRPASGGRGMAGEEPTGVVGGESGGTGRAVFAGTRDGQPPAGWFEARSTGARERPGGSVTGKARRWWRSLSRARRGWLLGGLAGGVICYLITGWVGLLLLLPAFGLVLPALLADPGNPTVSLLEALDRWLRSLTASVSTGKSIAEALRATAATAPDALAEPLRHVVARLDDRWPVRDVLVALADELASPDADAVAASLMVAAERGGVGTMSVLRALSGNVQQRLHAWRDIEAERAKPRIVVRQVTLISSGVIALGMLTGPSYFAAYGTPVGQLILIGLGAGYLASLVGLRQVTNAPPRARILVTGHPQMLVAPPGLMPTAGRQQMPGPSRRHMPPSPRTPCPPEAGHGA